jgi:2-polyprenyl-3-methyl-5-hydroxy-6-metoxy-1,4-benzoquinol methylase
VIRLAEEIAEGVMQELERLEEVAVDYRQDGFEGLMTHASADRLARCGTGSRCLEVGAAVGITTDYLSRQFESVVVIEPASRYAAMVRDRGLANVTVVETLFEDFVSNQKFHTIVMAHLLEHVEDPQGILRAAARLLDPDGAILITVPNGGSLHRRVGVLSGMLGARTDMTPADHSIGHRRVYEADTLRAEVETAGLRVQRLVGHFCKPLSNTQMQGLSAETQAAFLRLGDDLPPEYASELFVECRA